MKADGWWVVGGALVVFLAVLGVLADRYWCAVYWWPWVGTEWRAERADREWTPLEPVPGYLEAVSRGVPTGAALLGVSALPDEDDEWADQLHVINLATRVHPLLERSKTRAIGDLLYDEVEAVIRDLGDPWWVPQRLRTAA